MLAERGIDVSYETVRRWALKFGTIIARKLRRGRPRPDGQWRLDEDVCLRQWQTAVRLACRGQRRRGFGYPGSTTARPSGGTQAHAETSEEASITPATILTDKLRSYGSALRELGVARRHDTGRWKNNGQETPSAVRPSPETTDEALQVSRIGTALSRSTPPSTMLFNIQRHLTSRRTCACFVIRPC